MVVVVWWWCGGAASCELPGCTGPAAAAWLQMARPGRSQQCGPVHSKHSEPQHRPSRPSRHTGHRVTQVSAVATLDPIQLEDVINKI